MGSLSQLLLFWHLRPRFCGWRFSLAFVERKWKNVKVENNWEERKNHHQLQLWKINHSWSKPFFVYIFFRAFYYVPCSLSKGGQMMKFKSLFRRKASPTGNDPHSGVTSPSASSISHSSSSSSLATHSANSPVHSASGQVGGGLSSGEVSAGSPITITSRIRNSSTEPNLLVPRPVPGPQQADYQVLFWNLRLFKENITWKL